MKEKVIDIVAKVAEVPKKTLSEETNLITDLELESLDLVELVSAFEKEFKREIPDKDIKHIQTIQDIIKVLEDNV